MTSYGVWLVFNLDCMQGYYFFSDTFFCTYNLHNYSIFSTNPIPLSATTLLQLEPANSVFEPEEVNMNERLANICIRYLTIVALPAKEDMVEMILFPMLYAGVSRDMPPTVILCTHTHIHSHVLYRRSHSFSVLSWLPVTYATPATMAMPSFTPDNWPLWLLQGTLHTILYCRDQSEFAMDSNTKYIHTNVMLSGAPHVCAYTCMLYIIITFQLTYTIRCIKLNF